jgi:hypothetical protein
MPQSQPSGPVAVRLGGTDPLKRMLEELSAESREAIQRLFGEISRMTGREVIHTDPLDLFNTITSQTVGGIYVDVPSGQIREAIHPDAWPRLGTGAVAGGSGIAFPFWSTTTGAVQRLAVIFLRSSFNPTEAGIGLIMASYLVTAIHEMAHIAARDNRIIDHPDMNRAGEALGFRHFDDYVEKNCIDSRYWSFPPN